MRRILLLLIGLMAFGTTLPAAAPAAMARTHHAHTMPPGHCHDEAQGVAHICFGCAARPAELPVVADVTLLTPIPPVALVLSFVEGRRPGFDPPPPRRLG
jgi:hypothetical protein